MKYYKESEISVSIDFDEIMMILLRGLDDSLVPRLRHQIDSDPINPRLRIEVGHLSDEESKQIEDHFNNLISNSTPPSQISSIPLDTSIRDLSLSVRAKNCLAAGEIKTIGDLVGLTLGDLLKFRNLGKRIAFEIKRYLEERGLSLKNA